MKIRRIIALFIIAVLAAGLLAGCGNEQETSDVATTAATTTAAATEAETTAAATTTAATEAEPEYMHEWREATCDEPKTCINCGEIEGEPAPHNWRVATFEEPKTCLSCGETEGEPLPPPLEIDKWFESVRWSGSAVIFTALSDVTVTGVFVIADGVEHECTTISNTRGSMKFANGVTMIAGSSVPISHNPIVLSGTSVKSELELSGTVTEIIIVIGSGERLMKPL